MLHEYDLLKHFHFPLKLFSNHLSLVQKGNALLHHLGNAEVSLKALISDSNYTNL